MQAFCYFNGLPEILKKFFLPLSFTGSERSLQRPMVEGDYKNAHVHAELFQLITDLFLLINRPVHHTIIFNGAKAIIVGKLNLVRKFIASAIPEHPVMNGIIQMKGLRSSW